MNIKKIASQLSSRFHTRNPFEIAEQLGYIVIFCQLSGIRGFYQYIKRRNIIYIDQDLEYNQAKFVCAHELGHALLHKGINRFFMDSCTLNHPGRFEREADRFASELLFSDTDLLQYDFSSIEQASMALGIPVELVEYRMDSIRNEG